MPCATLARDLGGSAEADSSVEEEAGAWGGGATRPGPGLVVELVRCWASAHAVFTSSPLLVPQACKAAASKLGSISTKWKRMANAVLSGRTADLLAAGTAATAFHLMTMQTDVLVDVAEVRSMGRIR